MWGEQDAAMVSLISQIVSPRWCLSLWAHSTISCQHLLVLRSDFHNGKHRYRALERGRETEREREEGGRSGEWMGSRCRWAALLLQMLMDTPPKGGGGNKLSMRNEKQRRERESERGRDGGAVLFCSVLWPLVNLSQSRSAHSGSGKREECNKEREMRTCETLKWPGNECLKFEDKRSKTAENSVEIQALKASPLSFYLKISAVFFLLFPPYSSSSSSSLCLYCAVLCRRLLLTKLFQFSGF